tara:strand:+ start:479 stop:745 length:267 start_codon:yes stop_codon:yes gene_type:complete
MAEVIRVGHSDPGHGWLAVKLSELKMLGIEADITDFSYVKGKTAYLEEDKDASTYIRAMKAKGIDVVVRQGPPRDRSPIRSFKRYESA